MLNRLPHTSIRGAGFPAIPNAAASIQLALQYQLESTQWWSASALRAQQLRELAPLLQHAAATVPFYRERFARLGLTVPEGVTDEFFARIPITARSDAQSAGELMLSRQCPPDHGEPAFATTSGSTGRPVRFARNALTHSLWLAFALRDHLWHGRDFMGKLGAIRWYPRGASEPPAGERQPNWGIIVSPLFASGPSVTLNVAATLSQQVDWLMRERLDYLVSFPSNLAALVRHAREEHIALPAVREIRTVGETLAPRARADIARAFGAAVTDIYTCEEAGYLALQCPGTEHYHVQSENVLLEIVDQDGQPCAIGQPGRVLITTLHNYATPLIRYEVGDIAEFGPPCACGRGLPTIRRIHGRTRNRLRLPTGESLFPYLGEHGQIFALTGVKLSGFQCIQHTLHEIEIKLVAERPLDAPEQAAVAQLMQKNLGYPFSVRFSFVDDIPRGPSGKFEDFISRVA